MKPHTSHILPLKYLQIFEGQELSSFFTTLTVICLFHLLTSTKKTCWKTVSVRLPSKPRGCFGIECIFVCLKSVNQTSFHLCKFSGLRGLGGWFALHSNVHAIETCLFLGLQPCDAPTRAKKRKGVPAAPATDQCWTGLCHHL